MDATFDDVLCIAKYLLLSCAGKLFDKLKNYYNKNKSTYSKNAFNAVDDQMIMDQDGGISFNTAT